MIYSHTTTRMHPTELRKSLMTIIKKEFDIPPHPGHSDEGYEYVFRFYTDSKKSYTLLTIHSQTPKDNEYKVLLQRVKDILNANDALSQFITDIVLVKITNTSSILESPNPEEMNDTEIYNYFQCHLIRENVRSAFLMHDSLSFCEPFVAKHFPELILKRWNHVGISSCVVSKVPLDKKDLKSPTKLGKLLGYPGADEFKTMDPNNGFMYSIQYTLYDSDTHYDLFANLCATEKDVEHVLLLEKIKDVLQTSPILTRYIEDVFVHKSKRETL